jgi:uncharacterized protein (TIGR03083 family)
MTDAVRIDVWGAVRDERIALLADLERLRPDQWNTPSLCVGWTVRDVVAHLVAGADAGGAAIAVALVRSGFRLNRMLGDDARRRSRAHTPDSLLAAFRNCVGSQRTPPATRPWQMLSDTILHGQDIRRPLGLRRDFPGDRLVTVLDHLAPMRPILGVRKRISGLRLRATDLGWTHGDGPEVAGPGEALLLAMAGRSAALVDLDGDGVSALRLRLLSG